MTRDYQQTPNTKLSGFSGGNSRDDMRSIADSQVDSNVYGVRADKISSGLAGK